MEATLRVAPRPGRSLLRTGGVVHASAPDVPDLDFSERGLRAVAGGGPAAARDPGAGPGARAAALARAVAGRGGRGAAGGAARPPGRSRSTSSRCTRRRSPSWRRPSPRRPSTDQPDADALSPARCWREHAAPPAALAADGWALARWGRVPGLRRYAGRRARAARRRRGAVPARRRRLPGQRLGRCQPRAAAGCTPRSWPAGWPTPGRRGRPWPPRSPSRTAAARAASSAPGCRRSPACGGCGSRHRAAPGGRRHPPAGDGALRPTGDRDPLASGCGGRGARLRDARRARGPARLGVSKARSSSHTRCQRVSIACGS